MWRHRLEQRLQDVLLDGLPVAVAELPRRDDVGHGGEFCDRVLHGRPTLPHLAHLLVQLGMPAGERGHRLPATLALPSQVQVCHLLHHVAALLLQRRLLGAELLQGHLEVLAQARVLLHSGALLPECLLRSGLCAGALALPPLSLEARP